MLSETWVEEESWKTVREKLPAGFIWGWQAATRKHVKERAKRGMVMGIRIKLAKEGTEMAVEEKEIMMGYVKQDREKWKIVGVYVSGDIKQKLRKSAGWRIRRRELRQ